MPLQTAAVEQRLVIGEESLPIPHVDPPASFTKPAAPVIALPAVPGGPTRERFEAIAGAYRTFAASLGLTQVACVPISAATGENVVRRGTGMPWYGGPTVLEQLETADVEGAELDKPMRFAVQWVNRPNLDFRGFSGLITSGRITTGDEVVALPSGRSSKVSRIVTYDGDLPYAAAGKSVTLTLADEIDVSRGDVLAHPGSRPEVSDQAAAHIVWMSEEMLLPGRPYLMKCGGQWTTATVTHLRYKLNVDNLDHIAGRELALNDVGYCNLAFSKPIVFEPYAENRPMGGFILVDRVSNATVAAGMLQFGLRRASNIHWQALDVDRQARSALKGQAACCLWFTGLSGSGKSTIANLLDKRLHAAGRHTYMLDGDNVRHGLNRDLGFTDADRVENIRRVAEVARLMVDAGLIVIVSFISPFRAERQLARDLFESGEFLEVFVDTPIEVCEARDPKGLYKKARAGQLQNFTGITSAYEAPAAPEIRLDTVNDDAASLAEAMFAELERRKLA